MVAKSDRLLVSFFLFVSSGLLQYGNAENIVNIEEALPLFNVHSREYVLLDKNNSINSVSPKIPESAKLGVIHDELKFKGFIGETIFKDILLKGLGKNLDVTIMVRQPGKTNIRIVPRIVTSWYQAGSSTVKKSSGGVLTYELLLSNDVNVDVSDSWKKSPAGGWVYQAPVIENSQNLKTRLKKDAYKRLLIKVTLADNVLPGRYDSRLDIYINGNNANVPAMSVPISILVRPVKLTDSYSERFKLLLYTAFKLDENIGRPDAYVNSMRLEGNGKQKEKLLLAYLKDIKGHGFNGVTIRDWSDSGLQKTLELVQKAGLKYAVLHAATPVSDKYGSKNNPIISTRVRNIFTSNNRSLFYYGYDEVGGNKLLARQLELNRRIHALGGKSVNAVFWDDMPKVIQEIGKDKSACFDVVAYSMGSHGHKRMFASLPFKKPDDVCSSSGTEYLAYWHPHVENPVINRIFMGFWLWASGFDGVIPHGYYFPPNIAKVVSEKDKRKGESNAASPYDDWGFWLSGRPLRHHNSVYPSKAGPVSTLQWEGVLEGVEDLRYVLTLEESLEKDDVNAEYKQEVAALLSKIRKNVLKIDSPYMNDDTSMKYLKKLESWKRQIAELLLR